MKPNPAFETRRQRRIPYRLAASNYIRNREINLATLLKEAEHAAPEDAGRRP